MRPDDKNENEPTTGALSEGGQSPAQRSNYEDDPLIRLVGSGRHIWADEHADEYVENLRREDA